jgi:hypothetical protein
LDDKGSVVECNIGYFVNRCVHNSNRMEPLLAGDYADNKECGDEEDKDGN